MPDRAFIDALPPQQKAALEYLAGLPPEKWATRTDVAGALDTTMRGAGNVLARLVEGPEGATGRRLGSSARRPQKVPIVRLRRRTEESIIRDGAGGEWEYRATQAVEELLR